VCHACKLGLEGIVSKRLGAPYRSGPVATLGQEQESGGTGGQARSRGRLGRGSPPMSVAPETGRNRIMIYGPKPDGTYVVEFETADGDSLAISVLAGETRVLKHFQARRPG
jgi:hypothetical protein